MIDPSREHIQNRPWPRRRAAPLRPQKLTGAKLEDPDLASVAGSSHNGIGS